ncbi:hypothetical protein RchiOBHm_Chr7g0204591 [Rosa chinensis]|uniref:Uncharacterized protein n=1 Tax=Rosa chinensis TaxID=74649 RepID=A0A2P6P8R6_ROSCH|nr:hypothetical protein RchiOBHm_Chr7g0204591 [Rosa chinensis]
MLPWAWRVDALANLGFWAWMLPLGPFRVGGWVWAHFLGPTLVVIFFLVGIYLCCLVWLHILRVISPYPCSVGLVRLCACVCTQCTQSALSALGRQRVPCFVKWSLPLSDRVRPSVIGFILRQQHSRKAVHMVIMLRCNRVTYRVIFPLCHRYVKANRVVNRAFFASWCLVQYIYLVETHDSISGHSLDAYCNQGFRFNVLPPCI